MLASTSIGHAELERFCGIMGLPPPVSKRAYNEHLKKIRNVAVDTTYNVMIDAANRLRDIFEEEEPSKVYTDEGGRKIEDVAVTVDGTWQKRGHTSRIGVVFVMAVRTGEVLDYVIKSLSCHECRCHEMQNYYGLAIRNNIGNQLEMKRCIKPIHHHLIKREKLSSFE